MKPTLTLLTALLLAPLAVLCAAETIPPAPKNVRVTETSPAHIRVEWNDAVQNETGFRIWRRRLTDEGPRLWHLAGEVPAKVTHFDDGGLNHETEYEHKVAAFGPAGEGEAVAVAKATRTPRMVTHLEPQVIVPAGKSAAVAPSALAEPDGRILLAYSHSGTVWLRRSADGGKTWGDEQLSLPKPPQGYYTKAALARLQDGSVGLACTHLTPIEGSKLLDRKRLFTRSRDGSPPWSEPVLMGRSSANNAALILADHGRLLDPLDDGRHPSALIVASDDDGGRTWDNFRLIGFAPEGDDGFVQYSLSFGGDTTYLFYGGGTKGDTDHVTELRLLRLHSDFFTSRTPWPYDWKGEPKP